MASIRPRLSDRRPYLVRALLCAIPLVLLLAAASTAAAAETIYWDNYGSTPQTVGYANIDGSGGGALNFAGAELKNPEGMAIDTVTGTLYVASSGSGEHGAILWAKLDGSGAGVLSTPGAPLDSPEGVAVDPATRTIYWANTGSGSEDLGSIGWAKLDGSGGGTLNTTGTKVEYPYKIAIDPAANRVFWANTGETETVGFANLNNTGGGGILNVTGATAPRGISGLSVDPAAGRLYWLDTQAGTVSYAALNGTGGGDVNLSGASFNGPYGLALDPSKGVLYWGNYGASEERAGAIGYASVNGGGGGITIPTAPVDGVQDPLVLKGPTSTGAPGVTQSHAALSCSQGSWAADYAGSFVYQAPTTYAYQWSVNGQPIAGATAATLAAAAPGAYACSVTAANHAGSASQSSATVTVTGATLALKLKKRTVKAKAGKAAQIKVQVLNTGDLPAQGARLCVKVPKKAKKALKAAKCKSLATLAAGRTVTAKLRVKLAKSAKGSYKVRIVAKGVPAKAAKVKIAVVGHKRGHKAHSHKHHK